jgi:hypothetical protein
MHKGKRTERYVGPTKALRRLPDYASLAPTTQNPFTKQCVCSSYNKADTLQMNCRNGRCKNGPPHFLQKGEGA